MANERVRLHHQYPWRRQEIITLAALTGLPVVVVGLLVTRHAGGGTVVGLGGPVAVFCWGMAAYAARLGWTRKRRSRIEGTLTGTRLSFTGGRFRGDDGDLAEHTHVALRSAGPEQGLVFSHAGDGRCPDPEMVVPLRLVRQNAGGHDDLSATLHRLLDDGSRTVTPQARTALGAPDGR